MSLALLLIPFLPATNALFRVGFVLAERVLYLPSSGYCLLVAIGLHKLHNKNHAWGKVRPRENIYIITSDLFFNPV